MANRKTLVAFLTDSCVSLNLQGLLGCKIENWSYDIEYLRGSCWNHFLTLRSKVFDNWHESDAARHIYKIRQFLIQ